jgi:hypothetical protein
MSILKSENNPTEKYTIESFLSAVIAVAGLICFPVTIFLPCFGPIPWFFSLVLGLISWRGIKIKGGSKWTRILTIIGVVVSNGLIPDSDLSPLPSFKKGRKGKRTFLSGLDINFRLMD